MLKERGYVLWEEDPEISLLRKAPLI
jgi:hypothetical protein